MSKSDYSLNYQILPSRVEIVKKFEIEILTKLNVLDIPESIKHYFGNMSFRLVYLLTGKTQTQIGIERSNRK